MIVIRMLRAVDQRGSPVAGRGFDSVVITVWQLRHSNLSKCVRFSRDLLACMAMPQTGQ
ncbi:MAG: hypothetical protein HYX37_12500 [Rhizobiales bacterium]|jgi:hypothetical protein|nr:hypothetical protein [Hyphomicrobiales bacterium]